ncbi:MAG: carboxypeptidase regulatory-like domain-containing protein [Planctomycetota bacterium]
MSRSDSLLRQALFAALVLVVLSLPFISIAPSTPSGKGTGTRGPRASDEWNGTEADSEADDESLDPRLGIIQGRVVIHGKPPVLSPPIIVPASHPDVAKCVATVHDDRLIVSKDQGVKNSVVYVADLDAKKGGIPGRDYTLKGAPPPPATGKVTIECKGCMFSPRVTAVSLGTGIQLANADPFIHNTRGVLAAAGIAGSNALPGKGRIRPKYTRKTGWGLLQCDYHRWMQAHVHVFDHLCFDVTEADGTFRIVNVPPGQYQLRVWHEVLQNTELRVNVVAGGTTEVEVRIAAH